ncbi:peroxiredoxin [bacterium]|nr:peroxiredoxin [bacterium]MBR2273935.1 peroxiredoxin [Alphaproteobacteria bacterium]
MIFQAIDKNGEEIEFNEQQLIGKITVLYFYPKDNTSGCTKEACDFRDNANRLTAVADVVGISPDSIESHKKFQQKQMLNFMLVSDVGHELAKKYGVWKEKSMYGRKYMGIERSTFILDKKGEIIKEWRKVKVPGHVEEVLCFLLNI